MEIRVNLNGKELRAEVTADLTLYDFLRQRGCFSVKCGCETSNCGLCTVLMENKPVLSCSTLAVRADGKKVETLEGLQKEAEAFGAYLADEGGEQCGFCAPGLVISVIGMSREASVLTEQQIREYLAGNLCRCSGYASQQRAIRKFLEAGKGGRVS